MRGSVHLKDIIHFFCGRRHDLVPFGYYTIHDLEQADDTSACTSFSLMYYNPVRV